MPCIRLEIIDVNPTNECSVLLNFSLKCLLISRVFYCNSSCTLSLKQYNQSENCIALFPHLKSSRTVVTYTVIHSFSVSCWMCCFPVDTISNYSRFPRGSELLPSVLSLLLGSSAQTGLQPQIRAFIPCVHGLSWCLSSIAASGSVYNVSLGLPLCLNVDSIITPIVPSCKCCTPQETRLYFICVINPEI